MIRAEISRLGRWPRWEACRFCRQRPGRLRPSCADLAHATSAGRATWIEATAVAARAPPFMGGSARRTVRRAAFCRVQATVDADTDSSADRDRGLAALGPGLEQQSSSAPAQRRLWRRSFATPFLTMLTALPKGYAAAGTDMGHTGVDDKDAAWALHEPGRWGLRPARQPSDRLWPPGPGRPLHPDRPKPAFRLFPRLLRRRGREALMEATRFPTDYEGMNIAGAPANAWTQSDDRLRPRTNGQTPRRCSSGHSQCRPGVVQAAAEDPVRPTRHLEGRLFQRSAPVPLQPGKAALQRRRRRPASTDAQLTTLHKIIEEPINPHTHRHTSSLAIPRVRRGPVRRPGIPGLRLQEGQHGWFANAFFKDMVFSDDRVEI